LITREDATVCIGATLARMWLGPLALLPRRTSAHVGCRVGIPLANADAGAGFRRLPGAPASRSVDINLPVGNVSIY